VGGKCPTPRLDAYPNCNLLPRNALKRAATPLFRECPRPQPNLAANGTSQRAPCRHGESRVRAINGSVDMPGLCDTCRVIPWSKLSYPILRRQIVMTVTAYHDTLRLSSCAICRGLAIIKPRRYDSLPCILLASDSRRVPRRRVSEQPRLFTILTFAPDSPCLTLSEKFHACAFASRSNGFLAIINPGMEDFGFNPRVIPSEVVDWDSIRTSVSVCCQRHEHLHETTNVQLRAALH
jgi:hypothetical protein